MKKYFLNLTQLDNSIVLIKIKNIAHIQKVIASFDASVSICTKITMQSSESFFVQESPSDIYEMLRD